MPLLKGKHLKVPGYISRGDLRLRWGVSDGPIVRMIEQGTLVPETLRYKFHYFKEEDIKLIEESGLAPRPYKRKWQQDKNAAHKKHVEAFRLFRENATLADVVIACNLPPLEVDRLYEEYKKSDLEERRQERENIGFSFPVVKRRAKTR